MLVISSFLAGLLIALVLFVKGATSSKYRLRLTAVVQMFIDPINTILGITSLLILLKSKPNQATPGNLDNDFK